MANTTPLYPAKTIANLFNLTERRIQQLAKDGVIPKAAHGKYDLVGSVRGYVKYLQERAFSKDVVEAGDYHEHKTRLAKANADTQETRHLMLLQELVDRESVIIHWSQLVGSARAKLLALPTKLASAAIACQSLEEIQDAARAIINEALLELAADPLPSEVGVETTAGPDGEPVGGPVQETESRGVGGAGPVEDGAG